MPLESSYFMRNMYMQTTKPTVSKKKVQSIEPNIAHMFNGWLESYKLDYKLEQESLNDEIDKALNDYYTKNGGTGVNRPDAKLLLKDKETNYYPILIEYKGYKNKLVKLNAKGQVENKTVKNEPNFANINGYAVNGAVHYANALLHHTKYTPISYNICPLGSLCPVTPIEIISV